MNEQKKRTWHVAGSIKAQLCQVEIEAYTRQEAEAEYLAMVERSVPDVGVSHYEQDEFSIDYSEAR